MTKEIMTFSVFKFLQYVMHETVNQAVEGLALNWNAESIKNHIKPVWMDAASPGREKLARRVIISDIETLTDEQLCYLGFHCHSYPKSNKSYADRNMWLYPLYLLHYIADGEVLVKLDHKVVTKSPFSLRNTLDLVTKNGCICYGFYRKKLVNVEEEKAA